VRFAARQKNFFAQRAKSIELHTAMSLARLWQPPDKQADAQYLLSEIHGWFTEGFDTKDLQELKVPRFKWRVNRIDRKNSPWSLRPLRAPYGK
jgi:hypothetical protein